MSEEPSEAPHPAAVPPPDAPVPPAPPARRRRVLTVGVAVAALVVIAVAGYVIWRVAGGPTPAAGPVGAPGAAASAQARAVGDLVSAWVGDDRATIEKRITKENLPWTAPAPPIPGNVPRELLGAVVKPRMQGDTWVVGDESVALVKLTGDGITPTGTVTAEIVTPQGSRTVSVGVVLEGSAWKIATVDGAPAAEGLSRLLR